MFQWFNAWNCRSQQTSIFKLGLFSNKWLIGATMVVLLFQCALLYIPCMQQIFKTMPLSLTDWLLAVAVSSSILIVEEIRKYWLYKQSQI
jgi:Ca2+-transporting ATPase